MFFFACFQSILFWVSHDLHFQTFVTWLRENYDYHNVSWEMICIYMIFPCPKWEGGERNTCSFRSPWVTLPLNLFFPTHFVLFPFPLSCRWNCLSCRICFISSSMWFVCCCLRMQIIWHTALSSSHHAMCGCHHSVSVARSHL